MVVLRMCILGCVVTAGLAANGAVAAAQFPAAPSARLPGTAPLSLADTGSYVRAWRKDRFASPRYLEGALHGVTPQAVAIMSAHRGLVRNLAVDSISKIEIATGHQDPGRTIRTAALIGAIAGVWAGYELTSGLCGSCGGDSTDAAVLRVAISLRTVLAGAAIGGTIGAVLPASRTWQEVHVPR